ncbi:MAG: AMP-binding protein [Pleurocapsa sp. CRU_1_2]|nr:AMP-binding protein [Pleurocapsa sp. CRU_1_2]
MLNVSSFLDILSYRALHQPNKIAYTFLQDGETETARLTYQELDKQARSIAAYLQSVTTKGERALLLYPPGLDFIATFLGCLYAGVVAVPAYPPKRNRKISRIQAIVADAQPTLALTTKELLADMQQCLAEVSEFAPVCCLATDNLPQNQSELWQKPALDVNSLAFLQYTSGSTGTPKGVMVNHYNLLYNEQMIKQAFGHSEKSVVVGWLPFYHDMGLIGNVLQPMYLGISCILMPPVAFLQKPIRWLQAISRYQATTSGGPNFAYDLCIREITFEQKAGLDLSSWEIAFCGAEPIQAQIVKKFTAAFTSCGFRSQAFYPCYGMAETTLLVSGGAKMKPPIIRQFSKTALLQNKVMAATDGESESQELVGCGQTWLEQKIVIVDPESLTLCLPEQVGEIWVSGLNVAQGYWKQQEKTEETFHAHLADREGSFLRTGDLGFLQDGELFVTGRRKDLIIILGRNHYPQDIELTVEQSHLALRPNCGAAFAVEVKGSKSLVIVHEVQRSYLRKLNANKVIATIRQAIAKEHDIQAHAILLLKTGSLPKTSSGKVQRSACQANFESGSLNVVADWSTNIKYRHQFKHLESEIEFLLEKVKARNLQAVTDNSNETPVVYSQSEERSKSFSSSQLEEFESKNRRENSALAKAIESWLIAKAAEQLQVDLQEIDICQPLAQYGFSSLAAVRVSGELQDKLRRPLSPTILYDYPTIKALAEHLADTVTVIQDSIPQKVATRRQKENEAIAIIGIGCRFPEAKNPQEFWQLLNEGVDAISEVSASRWDANALYDSTITKPNNMDIRWGGFIEQVNQFDPQFFGISPREAESMDPQQRLLLEVAWEALEHAGQAPEQLSGSKTGVFVGISNFDYAQLQLKHSASLNAYSATGNAFSIAANRLSYLLDLQGPSLAISTACSSSLVAVHQACQSLYQEECNLALVGGVNLILNPQGTIIFSQAKMMAADGRCKTFDAHADGYVRGEGCGIVVLKRLSDAVRDGDNILASIKGSAINHDGRSNGLTAPNGLSQQAVICQALKNARVSPEQISYVEAHGTGTSLGDPIEVDSLKKVLMMGRSLKQPVWIGSVKTNIGHLEAAAGIAGLIKVVLSLHHEMIPRHLNLKQLNPYIDLKSTPLSIPIKAQKWSSNGNSRLAGVSSFGFGGTNAHIVVEEAPKLKSVSIDKNILNTF